MPHFHTRFCRIPLLWSFELRSKTGRNFLESFDLISCPMKRKAGVPISCFEAGRGQQPFPPSLQQGCRAPSPALWLQGLSSLISLRFQQCFSTCNTSFCLFIKASFSKDGVSVGAGHDSAWAKYFWYKALETFTCYCCTLQIPEIQRKTLHLSCRDQIFLTLKWVQSNCCIFELYRTADFTWLFRGEVRVFRLTIRRPEGACTASGKDVAKKQIWNANYSLCLPFFGPRILVLGYRRCDCCSWRCPGSCRGRG